MSVFKDFPGLENREKLFQDFQGLSRTRKSPVYLHQSINQNTFMHNINQNTLCTKDIVHTGTELRKTKPNNTVVYQNMRKLLHQREQNENDKSPLSRCV